MTRYSFGGVDPGLVHTGVVSLDILTDKQELRVRYDRIIGPNAAAAATFFADQDSWHMPGGSHRKIYIERYKPRGTLNHNVEMIKAERDFTSTLPFSKTILNTGVKQVVKQGLLEVLGLWKFNVQTNHDDIRSAAYIMVYGMLKDPEANSLLTTILEDHLGGETWNEV